jgi:hypothetical protein
VKGARRAWRSIGSAALAVALLSPGSASAAMIGFAGELEVNDAPISFEAKKRRGLYRSIPLFEIGDSTTGVPVECEDPPDERSYSYGQVDVRHDQTIRETDDFITIRAEFTRNERLRGTFKIDGVGQGEYCTTNGPLRFRATPVT